MQQMDIDYINELPRHKQKRSGDAKHTERRLYQMLLLTVGLLCIIQATLNISLRLSLHSRDESSHCVCNGTQFTGKIPVTDCERRKPGQCNRLQERVNALTADRNLLENRNNELNNMIKAVEEERNRLSIRLMELGGCLSTQPCPAGWTLRNSRCYFLSTEHKTWQDSRNYCLGKDADLVVISSEKEQRALYRLEGNSELLVWIGLRNTDGTFKWVDGSPLTKSFWLSDQPDRGGPVNREDCVEMYHQRPVLESWIDTPCRAQRRWLCEKDPCISTRT